jgi:hypothetical protein
MIHVVDSKGRSWPGEVGLDDHDLTWRFTPAQAWEKGAYQLAVQNIIEDLAGNNVGKLFEVESSSPVPNNFAAGMVRVDFQIR